jgi:MoaA/NifB/PqqE/SkfB family radical SAM enzyme
VRPSWPDPAYRVTWNIHWSCNFRCSYCFFDGHWTEYGKRNAYLTPQQWMVHWDRFHERFGRAYVTINGGEPFSYPRFVPLLQELTKKHWPVNVTTNGSLRLDEFLAGVDHDKVSVSLSFHPQYNTLEETLALWKKLGDGGAQLGCLNFVAWPPFLADLPGYLAKCEEAGVALKVIPFVGEWLGKRYPDAYSAAERERLGLGAPGDAAKDWIASKRHKGMPCRAGHRSMLLLPDGKVTRCGQIGDPGIFGSFLDESFAVLPGAASPCDVEFCPCDEWKVIPDEKPPEKPGAWLP